MFARLFTRFPASVYACGEEPDPRFSLANERTFLAWIRTALGLLGAAAALVAFDLPLAPWSRQSAAIALAASATVAVASGWIGWWSNERALRLRRSLPGFVGGALLAAMLTATVIILVVGLIQG